MKKHISLLLAILMCLSLISCGVGVQTSNDSHTGTYIDTVTESESTACATEDYGTTGCVTDNMADVTEPDSESKDIMLESESPVESDTEPEVSTETTVTETETKTETSTEAETEDVMDKVDFMVSVPESKEPVILQLTDPQIIDPTQQRSETRLSSSLAAYWATDKKDELCYDYIREIIGATNPDLIILTGDIVYGEFDDNGENLLEFISFMESFNIPWAPVFGNHDNESKMGADWQCAQLENATNCLFKQRTLTGNGNYTVGIEQGGKLTRVFFMLDSNGCGAASTASTKNGHTKTSAGFGNDQISWYTNLAKAITRLSPETKLSMAFHMQIEAFKDAMSIYSVNGSYTNVFIDEADNRSDGDFGFTGRGAKGAWDSDYTVWNSIKALGFDSVFVGHEHSNSSSIVYEGIRLQYGMKCSAYDRNNYIKTDGSIEVAAYSSNNTPWLGGSVFSLDADGEIKDPYIYYCGN